MKKEGEIEQMCVYCGAKLADTRDHVPPKSFFTKPRPADLITVPACQACNADVGKDEELFLATFMFSQAGVSPTGKKLWAEKLNRMYNRNLGLKRKIAASLQKIELKTPSGLFVRNAMAIKYDVERTHRVVSKIVRGLYYFEYHEVLSKSVEINCQLLWNETELASVIESYNSELRFGSRQWPGIFEYRFNHLTDRLEYSLWVLRFFGSMVFIGITGTLDIQP